MKSGIYAITNTVTGQRYIGSAKNFSQRWWDHTKTLRAQCHDNPRLQNAWNKYSEAAFKFSEILQCAPADLIANEQRCFDTLRPEYNILRVAGSSLGYQHTPETKRQLSILASTREHKPHPPGTGKKIGDALRGRVRSAEHSAAISAALTGKRLSAETRAKMRAAHAGFRPSEASKQHLRAILPGIKRSLEACANIQFAQWQKTNATAMWANGAYIGDYDVRLS